MALKTRSNPWLSRLHFVVRFLALVGLLAAGAALIESYVQGRLSSWDSARTFLVDGLTGQLPTNDPVTVATPWVFAVGLGAALFGLLVELLVGLRTSAARRGAAGANALLQVGLAAALLVGINWFSSQHHARFDLTRGSQFTLNKPIQEQLRQLRGKTTIVILQQPGKTGGEDKRLESYRTAAENVVIEKVRDLADMLRAFGPQFEVVLLDASKTDFQKRLEELAAGEERLLKAVEEAPGSSILIFARGEDGAPAQVQRISFDDFYQLDRKRSLESGGQGNLVLLTKGVQPLTNRILNLEEKRPRAVVLVVHQALSTEGARKEMALKGLRKTLTQHGWDVRDVVLKREFRLNRGGDLTWETAANSIEESKFEALRVALDQAPRLIEALENQVRLWGKEKDKWKAAKPAETGLPEEIIKARVTEAEDQLVILKGLVDSQKRRHDELKKEMEGLNPDVIGEQQRTSDLRAKLERLLTDCDLVIVPRLTLLPDGETLRVPTSFHRLDEVHVNALKDFLKQGKPLLACLGPPVTPQGFPPQPPSSSDGLEQLLGELHIHLGKKTVVYDVQAEELHRRLTDPFLEATPSEIPAIDFARKPAEFHPARPGEPPPTEDAKLRESLARATQARGKELDLRLTFARPVHYDADRGERWKRHRKPLGAALFATPLNPLGALTPMVQEVEPRPALDRAAEFLWTAPQSWNEEEPVPSDDRPLRYEPPKENDPTRGTLDERRRGPFPVGVAVEAKIPPKWYPDGKGEQTARVAVIGHGSTFIDGDLSPAAERLLLDTSNWLLKRDDLLTRDVREWSYPRVALDEKAEERWRLGTWLGLPVLFLFLGAVVLLARQVR